MQNELKQCKCGSGKVLIFKRKFRILSIHRWYCMIVCDNYYCSTQVLECGFTQKRAYNKAVDAWNRRVDGEHCK